MPAGAAAAAGGCGLSGAFRSYSERIFYDQGGSGGMATSTRQLVVSGGRWQYGTSSGSVRTAPIGAADWRRWGIAPYGPTSKVVFSGWNGGTASGPIEGSAGALDFFWLIYRVGPPAVHAAGSVELKFGHAAVCAATAASSAPAAGKARLTVSRSALVAGGALRFHAAGFPAHAALDLSETYSLGGKRYRTGLLGGDADGAGALSFLHQTTLQSPPGLHTICVSAGSARACASFTVTKPAAAASTATSGGASSDGGYQAPTTGPGYVAPASS